MNLSCGSGDISVGECTIFGAVSAGDAAVSGASGGGSRASSWRLWDAAGVGACYGLPIVLNLWLNKKGCAQCPVQGKKHGSWSLPEGFVKAVMPMSCVQCDGISGVGGAQYTMFPCSEILFCSKKSHSQGCK